MITTATTTATITTTTTNDNNNQIKPHPVDRRSLEEEGKFLCDWDTDDVDV